MAGQRSTQYLPCHLCLNAGVCLFGVGLCFSVCASQPLSWDQCRCVWHTQKYTHFLHTHIPQCTAVEWCWVICPLKLLLCLYTEEMSPLRFRMRCHHVMPCLLLCVYPSISSYLLLCLRKVQFHWNKQQLHNEIVQQKREKKRSQKAFCRLSDLQCWRQPFWTIWQMTFDKTEHDTVLHGPGPMNPNTQAAAGALRDQLAE